MRKLRDLTGETVLLASLYGSEGVVLAQVESNQPVKVTIRIGHHFPLHSAAPGKILLAYLSQNEQDEIIEKMNFTPFTDKTTTDRTAFKKILEQVRKNGFAFDLGEELPDIRCAAVPVLDANNYPEGAIWFSGPASRLPNYKLKEHLEHLLKYVNKINSN